MVPNAFEIVSGITGKYIYKTFQIVFFCSYYCQLYLKKKQQAIMVGRYIPVKHEKEQRQTNPERIVYMYILV